MSAPVGLSYAVKSRQVAGGGAYRPFAETTCADCGVTGRVGLNNANNNPEFVAKLFEREGWEFNPWRAGKCACAACVESRKDKRHGEKPEKGTNVVKLATAQEARQPTTDERAAIRRALDAHFDDSKGLYLDGQSDQRIGATLDLPWAMVRALREAAYGPIKGDPELDAVRGEVVAINARADDIKKQADTLARDALGLLGRVNDIAKRLGVA